MINHFSNTGIDIIYIIKKEIWSMYKKYLIVLVFCIFGSQIRAMDSDDDILSLEDVMEALEASIATSVAKNMAEAAKRSVEAKSFQSTMLNTRNPKGHTALHMIIMHPDERDKLYPEVASKLLASERVLTTYDMQQAKHAAARIKMGAKIDIKDNDQRTVCDIAEKNKTVLPHIYKVIMAGKTIGNESASAKSEAYRQAIEVLDKYSSEKK